MADVASIIVRIVTEKKGDAGKELEGTAARVDGVSKKFAKFAAPAAAAGAAVLAFGASAVKSASRTEQAMGGIDAVFGKNAGQVKKWASGAADSVGLASSQYAEFAAVLGSQLKGMGLPLDQVTGKTNDLIKMGADLSATFGGTTAEAVEALSSVLKGETDPIEKYGVTLKQADINAQKAANGASGLTGEADKQATAMATLQLVTKATADAQGQYAKQQGSTAEQAQRAAAKFEDMKSALGTALLPVVAAAAAALGNLAGWIGQHPRLAQIAGAAILVLAAAILALVAVSKIYTAALVVQQAIQKATWLSALGPIALVIAAIALVVGAIVLLWNKSETFRAVVLAVWAAIQSAAVSTAHAISAAWTATWNAIKAVAGAVFAVLRAYISVYVSAAQVAFNAVKTAVGGVSTAINTLTGWIGRIKVPGAISTAFDTMKTAVGKVSTAISTLIGWVGKISIPDMAGPFVTMKSAIDKVIGAIDSLIGWLGRIKVPKIHIPTPGGGSRSVAPSSAAGVGVDSPGARAAIVPMGGVTGAGVAGSVVININGAIDPEGTARQIRRIMSGSAVRHSTPGGTRGLRTAG